MTNKNSNNSVKNTGARSTDLVATIKRNRVTGIPTFVFGPPGVGKSDQVQQAAGGDRVIDVRLSMLDPVDLRGLPTVSKGKDGPEVEWARPEFIPAEGKGIIVFDELNTAPIAVQNAALQIILDRRCGPHKLGDGWYIVACGNKAAHRAHVNPMSAPLRNRFAIVEYEPTVEAWTRWAVRNEVSDDVVAFLNFSGEHLMSEPTDEHSNFASPRAWARVSQFIKADISDVESYTQLVGRGSAVAFSAFQEEIADMPDIDELIAGKSNFDHSTKRISVSYAVAMALASRLIRPKEGSKRSDEMIERCGEIVSSLPPEIACLYFVNVLYAKEQSDLTRKVIRSKSGQAWAKKHYALLEKYGAKYKSGE
jgi:hypothetical protein